MIEKEEMEKEMEIAEKHENQRKLEEEDDFEGINHEEDKREAKRVDDVKVQVNENKFCGFCSLLVIFREVLSLVNTFYSVTPMETVVNKKATYLPNTHPHSAIYVTILG